MKYNIESLRLDPMKEMLFKEYLDFKLSSDNPTLDFYDFNRICGISRQQWDAFRIENKKLKKVEWII